MNSHDVISVSAVSATPIKSSTGFSGIRLVNPLGRSADDSIDLQPIGEDIDSTRERIRKEIIADRSLSLYAQNIEISAGPSSVTLNGSVKSQEEKERIGTRAAATVKGYKVFNRLVVRSSQSANQRTSSRLNKFDEGATTQQEYIRIRRLWGIPDRSGCRSAPR